MTEVFTNDLAAWPDITGKPHVLHVGTVEWAENEQ